MRTTLGIIIAVFAIGCGGPASAPPVEPDETTETWTSGDDEALGIGSEDEPASGG